MPDGTAIVEHEEQPSGAVVTHSAEEVSFVERVLVRYPDIDLDRLERLIQMEKDARASQAEELYLQAMADAQAEMPRVQKNQSNDHTKSKYADLAAVDAAMKPIITKHGFSLTFKTVATDKQGYVRVGVTVAHRGGHKTYHEDDYPLDNAGAKGNSNKTGIQAWGSTVTYARRYLKLMVFDVATSDDNDGNKNRPAPETLSPEEMTVLDDLLIETGADRNQFFAYAKVSGMAEIHKKNFGPLKKILEEKLEQKND